MMGSSLPGARPKLGARNTSRARVMRVVSACGCDGDEHASTKAMLLYERREGNERGSNGRDGGRGRVE